MDTEHPTNSDSADQILLLNNNNSNRDTFLQMTSSNQSQSIVASTESLLRTCAACRQMIVERYFLNVADSCWHTDCLRCCICDVSLDKHITCYSKEGMIFCKDDYER